MFTRILERLDVFKLLPVTSCMFLFHSFIYGQNEVASMMIMDWSKTNWQNGLHHQIFQMENPDNPDESIQLTISIENRTKGSFAAFAVLSPYIDGREIKNFGKDQNLGLMFDPAPGQGNSAVLAKLEFSRPVQYLEFRISDIDGAEGRIDSIRVYANGGSVSPVLSILSNTPTVKIAGRSAVAIGGQSGSSGVGSAYGGDDDGDVLVTFRDEYLDSVTIEYYEASGLHDPSARGIGVFADLSFQAAKLFPMNLLKFGIAMDGNCQPVVRWVTNQEFAIDEYIIEYSYDGYNFSKAGSMQANNKYSSEVEYELPLYRNLNTDNYFRLIKSSFDGSNEILTSESISGSECFQFTSINVYPNPSSGNFVYVEIEATEQKSTDIAIINHYGEILIQTQYELKRGRNLFKLESRHLVPGIYNLRFAIDQEIVSKRVSIVD